MLLLRRNRPTGPPRFKACRAAPCVQEQIELQLRTSPYRELAHTTGRFQAGVAILEGEVSSYYLKQLAQAAVRQVPGVVRVINQIHVRTSDEQLAYAIAHQQRCRCGRLNCGREDKA